MSKSTWITPNYFFKRCEKAWGPYELDAAASLENTKCSYWLGPGSEYSEDALTVDWSTETLQKEEILQFVFIDIKNVWLNPPWGSSDPIAPWANKAIEQSNKGLSITMLLPWGRWAKWHEVMIKRAEMVRVIGRIPFIGDDGEPAKNQPGCNIIAILRPPIEGITWPTGFTGATILGTENKK